MHNSNTASLKECQHCEAGFVPRRSDAKFCSRKCRNDSGNSKKLQEREEYQSIVGETHKILWKNRNILLRYVGQTVSWDTLKASGFNFRVHTGTRNIDKSSHYGYYDLWLFSEKSNHYKIYKNG